MDVPVFSTGVSVVEVDWFNVVVLVEGVVIEEEVLLSIEEAPASIEDVSIKEVEPAVDSSELGGLKKSVATSTSKVETDDSSQQL